jgi:hypothetical protein
MLNCYSQGLEFITSKPDESLGQAMMYDDSTNIQNPALFGTAKHRKTIGYQSQHEEWLQKQTTTIQIIRYNNKPTAEEETTCGNYK